MLPPATAVTSATHTNAAATVTPTLRVSFADAIVRCGDTCGEEFKAGPQCTYSSSDDDCFPEAEMESLTEKWGSGRICAHDSEKWSTKPQSRRSLGPRVGAACGPGGGAAVAAAPE